MNVFLKYNSLKEPEFLTCSVRSPMPECSPSCLDKLQSCEVKGKLNCFWLFCLWCSVLTMMSLNVYYNRYCWSYGSSSWNWWPWYLLDERFDAVSQCELFTFNIWTNSSFCTENWKFSNKIVSCKPPIFWFSFRNKICPAVIILSVSQQLCNNTFLSSLYNFQHWLPQRNHQCIW